jgi:anthranilate synthase/phosphoribosyltransferase
MILVVDNYDSFTWNLVQYLGELGAEPLVRRNDEITPEEIATLGPEAILLSPGPKSPTETEPTNAILRAWAGKLPILGVCLGHQCLGHVYGGRVVRAARLMHGKVSPVHHHGRGLFRGLPDPFPATRYHSLLVERESLPSVLEITAWTDEGEIMGMKHRDFPLWGVQFHPESILTEGGMRLLANFLDLAREWHGSQRTASVSPGTDSVRAALALLADGGDLDRASSRAVVTRIMRGEATPTQIGALLMGLRLKGETLDELAGAADAMRAVATPVHCARRPLLDTCGTGGDGRGTPNVSTAAGLVAASCGAVVAKHGNRSVSSRSGSADVLEAAGVRIDLSAEEMGRCLEEVGFALLFAPTLHGAMKHAIGPRREMQLRTIFNLLGPLTNPAGAERQLLGVYDEARARLVAGALRLLGIERAWVVHGLDGLDELSVTADSVVFEVAGEAAVREWGLTPEDAGLPRHATVPTGGDPAANARWLVVVLDGSVRDASRDMVVLNAAAGLVVAGLAPSLPEARLAAEEAINRGKAAALLVRLRDVTNRL